MSAPCVGSTHLFFAPENEWPKARRQRVSKAQAVCATCADARTCLAEARQRGEMCGVWGGVDLDPYHRGTVGQGAAPIVHGGPGGSIAHYRRGETPCDECRNAHNTAEQQRRISIRATNGPT